MSIGKVFVYVLLTIAQSPSTIPAHMRGGDKIDVWHETIERLRMNLVTLECVLEFRHLPPQIKQSVLEMKAETEAELTYQLRPVQ